MSQEKRDFPREFQELLLQDYDRELSHSGVDGTRIAKRLAELTQIGLTEENGSNRMGFSKEERQAKELVKTWMADAGLDVREDGAGNVFGRMNGLDKVAPLIMAGSHVDTVPNGGHFDGTLGVITALEVVEAWKNSGFTPKKSYEVVIFTDEEGARFSGGLTGSAAMMGETNRQKQTQLNER